MVSNYRLDWKYAGDGSGAGERLNLDQRVNSTGERRRLSQIHNSIRSRLTVSRHTRHTCVPPRRTTCSSSQPPSLPVNTHARVRVCSRWERQLRVESNFSKMATLAVKNEPMKVVLVNRRSHPWSNGWRGRWEQEEEEKKEKRRWPLP